MHISNLRIKRLLTEYANGTIKAVDRDELLNYLKNVTNDPELDASLAELFDEMEVDPNLIIESDRIYHDLTSQSLFKGMRKPSKRMNLWWLAGTAAAIGLLVFRLFLLPENSVNTGHSSIVSLGEESPTTLTPSGNKAILRLADGTEIDLDEAENGTLALENNLRISLNGTTIKYEGARGQGLDEAMGMNTLSTTSGRQFQVILPDGTRMWLNALSSLTYPMRFDPKFREVEITGEAYFEVEQAKDWPFIVRTSTQEIRVLGTHFNISAYPDDPVFKTTLVEGSLKVTALGREASTRSSHAKQVGRSIVLKPGQQAITYKEKEGISLEKVDSEEVISWKKNLFVFHNEDIREGMKKVMRWYDVEVVYRDEVEGLRIGGTIPRFEKIEQLMDALEATGLFHYKMEGGKVVIMK